MSADQDRHPISPDGRPLAEQPKWRRDFPIDWAEDDYVSRRDLVRFMVLTSLAFVTGQVALLGKSLLNRRSSQEAGLRIVAVDELAVGDSFAFEYPVAARTPRLLVRTGSETFVAYERQCTHLLCPVVPRFADGTLHCPCHNGVFDLATGRPIAGPPRRALERVRLEVRDGAVYATGIARGALADAGVYGEGVYGEGISGELL